MNALEIRDLTKHYAGFSLDHLNLTLPWGCIMGLVGENGAGKSTGTLALSVPGLTTRRRIPQSGRHWSRASGTGSSIPLRKRSG